LTKAQWLVLCGRVADMMKVHTRPFVPILAGAEIGTGTFVDKDGATVLTCAHVADCKPHAYYVDDTGSTEICPGAWRADPAAAVDAACAPMDASEWSKISARARLLSMSRFAKRHSPVPNELLFFRGIAGENAVYVSGLGADVVLTGYCSQEKVHTGDANIFEMLWDPNQITKTTGTAEEVRDRVKHDDPRGFSGSLVWNTRFVERGCDLSHWKPDDAEVSGLLRRYDAGTGTLLAWRVEHLLNWL
jgi:hypothetical protein